MEIRRYFTSHLPHLIQPGEDVDRWDFSQIAEVFDWEDHQTIIKNQEGDILNKVDGRFPKHWPAGARDIVTTKYFRMSGVPSLTEVDPHLPQEDVDKYWAFSPRVPAPECVFGPEKSLNQVLSRMVGCWVYHAIKGNYVDAGDRASQAILYDELYYMLVTQMAFPNSPQMFNTGLHWAYGISGTPQGNWFVPSESNIVDDREACLTPDRYSQPQAGACFILNVKDNLVGENGIFDNLTNEAKIFKGGSGAGSNFSNLRGTGEPLSGGGASSGLLSWLKIYDSAAGGIKSGGTCLAPYTPIYTDEGPQTVKYLAEKEDKFVCLSYDPPSGRYKAKWATAWLAGRKEVVRVTTDKGSFDVSYDHPVKLATGEYVQADSLKEGQSLFSCTIDSRRDYLRVGLRDGKKGKMLLHRLFAQDILGVDLDGNSIHHIDGDKRNNSVSNLEAMKLDLKDNNHRVVSVEVVGLLDVYDVEVDCPTADDKSPETGHNFVIWSGLDPTGSGVVVANTRRAAKMVILNDDHPDILKFIAWKVREELKVKSLEAGHTLCKSKDEDYRKWAEDVDLDITLDYEGEGYSTVSGQNSNNTVRVTDAFLSCVKDNDLWRLIGRCPINIVDKYESEVSTEFTTPQGKFLTLAEPLKHGSHEISVVKEVEGRYYPVLHNVPARDVWHSIAHAAWKCADPGIHFHDMINDWHTLPKIGPQKASNPCFVGSTRIHTTHGMVPIEELYKKWVFEEEDVTIYTHGVTGDDPSCFALRASDVVRVVSNGPQEVVKVSFLDGTELTCTPKHRIYTLNRGYVAAEELTYSDSVAKCEKTTAATTKPEFSVEDLNSLTLAGAVYAGNSWKTKQGTFAQFGDKYHSKLLPLMPEGSACADLTISALLLDPESSFYKEFEEILACLGVEPGDPKLPEKILQLPVKGLHAFLRGVFYNLNVSKRPSGVTNLEIRVTPTFYTNSVLKNLRPILALLGVNFSNVYSESNLSKISFNEKSSAVIESILEGEEAVSRDLTLEDVATQMVSITPAGVQDTYNLEEPLNHSYIAEGILVANCSEYLWIDNSCCNLASLNLLKFCKGDGIDPKMLGMGAMLWTLVLEISVYMMSTPTKSIAENTFKYRTLGLGFTNLGALIMRQGLPYDSDMGRAIAGAVSSILTGSAYIMSARISERLGPLYNWDEHKEDMLRVIHNHRAATSSSWGYMGLTSEPDKLNTELLREGGFLKLADKARSVWSEAYAMGQQFGFRNAQVSVIAPTGTIGLTMSSDTTGVEPDFSLYKFKKLAGGGYISIVNESVAPALEKLGYSSEEISDIIKYIKESPHHSLQGSPLKEEHLAVFDCATSPIPNGRAISWQGHVGMLAAVQPFISGSISKTVNLPSSATVNDVKAVYEMCYDRGVKVCALYRDGCKMSQPLNSTESASTSGAGDTEEVQDLQEQIQDLEGRIAILVEELNSCEGQPRRMMPDDRVSITHRFNIAGHKGHVTVGLYPDGEPGEVFVSMSKEGSTVGGLLNSWAIAVSMGLQYGCPVDTIIRKFKHMRFEPMGPTMAKDRELMTCSSVVDYIARYMEMRFVTHRDKSKESISKYLKESLEGFSGEEEEIVAEINSSRVCTVCGSTNMIQTGICFTCANCNSSGGCG